MDKAQFWRLIEDAKREGDGDCEEQVDCLGQSLAHLTPEELISFDWILDVLRDAAYRWDLWAAGQLINGLCSDDGFEYFRCWLIARGQTVYENALKDPDSLADIVDPDFDDAECEALLYVAMRVYEEKTGQEMPQTVPAGSSPLEEGADSGPMGEMVDDDNVERILPRLCAMAELQEEG